MPTPTEMNSDIGSSTQQGDFTTKTSNMAIYNSSYSHEKQTHPPSELMDSPTTTTNGETRGKKRNSNVSNNDLPSLNQIFSDIFDILAKYDKKYNIKRLSPFQTIQERINTSYYKHPDDFKSDLDLLFTKMRSAAKTHQQNDIEHLYISVLASIQLEVGRDHPSLMMDTATLSPNNRDRIRTALFRPTIDGFIFTDANPGINQLQEHLPTKLQTIAVHPAPPDSFTIPTLKQSIQQPYKFPSRFSKHEDKPVIPVQWLDYGVYTTFAPVCDSNNANTSYESTYMGRAAKRHRRWERKQRRQLLQMGTNKLQQQKEQHDGNSDMDYDIDVAWLKDQGLDVDAILERVVPTIAEKDQHSGDDYDDTVSLLEKNEKLIRKLLINQENRFKCASVTPSSDVLADQVDEKEQEAANKLQQNLYQMLSHVTPSSVLHQQDIELAMSRLPLQEVAYRGSLPSNKIFAFPTSEKIDNLPPPFANITPTYSKDRWRLIDVQGHDQPSFHAQPQSQSQPPMLSSPSPSFSASSSPSSPLAVASPSTSQKQHPPHTSSPLRP